ncbi:MAG: hypothetical protein ACOX1S_12015 [Anaerostipes sp.]|nr:hypothetical protein [Anaerostipes sp.]
MLESIEYEKVLKVSLSQLHALYAYLGAPSVSTQHGVKGEGHNNACFIAEDSTRNPIVYMYEFFRLLCVEDVNLTDFQNFYYDYVSEIKSIDLTYLKPAKTYNVHEGEYLKYAQYIKNKYKDNKYLSKPNSTNAKEKLVIIIDGNKIASFRDKFIEKMKAIGFNVKGI